MVLPSPMSWISLEIRLLLRIIGWANPLVFSKIISSEISGFTKSGLANRSPAKLFKVSNSAMADNHFGRSFWCVFFQFSNLIKYWISHNKGTPAIKAKIGLALFPNLFKMSSNTRMAGLASESSVCKSLRFWCVKVSLTISSDKFAYAFKVPERRMVWSRALLTIS